MDYAIENEVGLTPENPHIIYAESSKGRVILRGILPLEIPFSTYFVF